MKDLRFGPMVVVALALAACGGADDDTSAATEPVPTPAPAAEPSATVEVAAERTGAGTCLGIYPSYWQDPEFPAMYKGQTVSNQAPDGYDGPVFRLSDAFPTEMPDEAAAQPWRDSRFDAMFDPATDQATKTELANEYSWLVMAYIQEGNVDSGDIETDWDVCNNTVRSWYHIPFQTYNVLAGREFTHGLTREAPVTFSMKTAPADLKGTMWAIGFFNPTAAYSIGTVWGRDGAAQIPTENVSFAEGAVVGKPLFTTLDASKMPMLKNLPSWTANISDPSFCGCKPAEGSQCSMVEESQQCPRSLTEWNPVTLLQFDIAIKDSRAPGTEWVFGTFVADGHRKADEPNPWSRMSPLGLMWGNSTPPAGTLASAFPDDPRTNGFEDMVIFWDTVDMLNADGGQHTTLHPGHLGCNSRLDGPADKQYSSCMSCHGTASVADDNIKVPPIAAQFGGLTSECAMPDPDNPGQWIDASGATARIRTVGEDGPAITYPEIDSIYFASTAAATPFNATVVQSSGPVNILPGQPDYGDARTDWISLDYSLQFSISIQQWKQWQQHLAANHAAQERIHSAKLPRR
ncbi:MAG: hypothetical protein AAGE01_19335 [Pseudomonadota bacterium]